MEKLLDVGTAVLLLAATVIGYRRGLLRSLAGVVVLVAALFAASWVAGHLAPVLTGWVQPLVQSAVWQKLQGGAADLNDLPESLRGAAQGLVDAGASAAVNAVRSAIYPVIHTVLYIVSFILARALLGLLARPILRACEGVPVLGGLNSLLGALLGALGGLLALYALLWVLQATRLLKPELISQTKLLAFFAGHSLVELFNRMVGFGASVQGYIGRVTD